MHDNWSQAPLIADLRFKRIKNLCSSPTRIAVRRIILISTSAIAILHRERRRNSGHLGQRLSHRQAGLGPASFGGRIAFAIEEVTNLVVIEI